MVRFECQRFELSIISPFPDTLSASASALRPSSFLAPYGRDQRSIAAFMTCNQSDVLQIIAAFTADNETE